LFSRFISAYLRVKYSHSFLFVLQVCSHLCAHLFMPIRVQSPVSRLDLHSVSTHSHTFLYGSFWLVLIRSCLSHICCQFTFDKIPWRTGLNRTSAALVALRASPRLSSSLLKRFPLLLYVLISAHDISHRNRAVVLIIHQEPLSGHAIDEALHQIEAILVTKKNMRPEEVRMASSIDRTRSS